MTPIPVDLATEDELSEITLLTLLSKLNRFAVGTRYRRNGNGYLRQTIHGWNKAAKGRPFIVLTDLDQSECPARLIDDWLEERPHPNLLFRIAVREIESWILADPENLAKFLHVNQARIPANTDALPDPKAALLNVARQARSKTIRDRIVPRVGSTARKGPDYNGCLGTFVREHWDINTAKANSPSLARTIARLNSFNPVWI